MAAGVAVSAWLCRGRGGAAGPAEPALSGATAAQAVRPAADVELGWSRSKFSSARRSMIWGEPFPSSSDLPEAERLGAGE